MKRIPLSLLGAIGLSLVSSPPTAQAGLKDDIIRLTHRLEESAANLNREFDAHYRGTYQYRSLIGCVRSLEGRARHIHGLAHGTAAASRELRQDVRSMDATVQRIYDDLQTIARSKRRPTGNAKHVHNELAKITRTLRSLDALATEKIRRQNSNPQTQFPIPNPLTYNSAPLHPHYGSGNRNVGNFLFPNQSSNYAQYGPSPQNQRPSSYGNRGYGNRNVSTGNRYSHSSSHRDPGPQAPVYQDDPVSQILQSLFRGFHPR